MTDVYSFFFNNNIGNLTGFGNGYGGGFDDLIYVLAGGNFSCTTMLLERVVVKE